MGMPGEKYLDTWRGGVLREPGADGFAVLDLFLCESQRLVLRPGQLYYFRVDPDCERCKEIEAEGKQ